VDWLAVTAPDLYAQLRPRDGIDGESEFRRFADVPLLLLDDLGAAKNSEWTEEINYRLIGHRYAAMLPCLITSNVPVAQLKAILGDRVASRLREMCQFVALTGPDRRTGAVRTAR
jgi:DNA replication protein DnaC